MLRTRDGGKTWQNMVENLVDELPCGEWGWKIQFLPKNNYQYGFVSLENFTDAAILKTCDGGETWQRMRVARSQDPNEGKNQSRPGRYRLYR